MHGSHHSVTPLDWFVVFLSLMCSVWASVSPLISSLDSPVIEPGFSQGFFLHSVTDGVLVSPSWELQTASPRGRYGERRQVDLCLKHTHIKTSPVGRRQPMTSLPARPQYKGRRENTSSTSFVFTDCFVWSVQSGKSRVFSLLSWRALARRLRSVWIRVLVIWHPMTHTIFASFVWAKSTHAMSLRGKSACTVNLFSVKKLRSRLSLFSRKEGQPSASRDSGPTTAEARRPRIFSRIHRFKHASYADIEGMRENGYEGMPPCKRR